MKPSVLPWLVVSVLAVAGPVPAQATSLAEIRQRGYMIVAVAAESSAFATVRDGKRTGFDEALLDRLRETAGFEIRERVVPAKDLTGSLLGGEVDAIASAQEITLDEAAAVEFSSPLAESTLYYLIRRDDDAIAAPADLCGRRLGFPAGAVSLQSLAEIEHDLAKAGNGPLGPVTEFPDAAKADRALETGKVEYLLGSVVDLAAQAKGDPKALAVGQAVAHKTYVAWAVARNAADLAAFLRDFLAAERSSGELARLQGHWLGWRFPDLPDSVAHPERWAARNERAVGVPAPDFRESD